MTVISRVSFPHVHINYWCVRPKWAIYKDSSQIDRLHWVGQLWAFKRQLALLTSWLTYRIHTFISRVCDFSVSNRRVDSGWVNLTFMLHFSTSVDSSRPGELTAQHSDNARFVLQCETFRLAFSSGASPLDWLPFASKPKVAVTTCTVCRIDGLL